MAEKKKAGRPVEETPTKIDGTFLDVFKVVKENKEQNAKKNINMGETMVYNLEKNGHVIEVFVTEKKDAYLCLFGKGDGDFINSYNAFGFWVTFTQIGKRQTNFHPIFLRPEHILTNDVMAEFWEQIRQQMSAE